MSHFYKLIAIAVFAMLCSHTLSASSSIEGTYPLSVEELFKLADANSASIRSCQIATEVADAAIADAKALRLPDVEAQLSFSYLGNGSISDRDFSNIAKADMPHYGNNFYLKASQPLFAGGAISSQINLAKMGKEMATHQLDAARSEIRFTLIGYYLQIAMLNNQIAVYEANIAKTQKVIAQMRIRQKQGTVLKNDITRYELQLENLLLQRTRVEDNKKIINHRLVTIVALPASTIIVPDSTVTTSIPQKMNEAEWQSLATQNSPSLRISSLNIDMKREQERLEKSARLPKIALIAEEHLDGPITIEVPPINKNFNYWFVGLGVSYDISSLFKANKKIRTAQISTRKASQEHTLALENVENEVQAAYTNYLTSFSDLSTQIKSVELANQNYSVVNNRYNNGLALITDMTDAANMKLSAELALVNSRINVIYNYYNMLFVSHTL